jgi:hypothetical protein
MNPWDFQDVLGKAIIVKTNIRTMIQATYNLVLRDGSLLSSTTMY